jgi:Spy/CpxP family protein refolding chaperone
MIRRMSAIAALIAVLGGAIAFRATTQADASKSANLSAEHLFAQAEPERPEKGPGMGWLKELNLSAGQMQQIRAVREKYRDRIRASKQSERQAQQELRRLMGGDASKEQVQEKYRQVKTLREQVADAQFESMLAMRDVLTVEQRQKFAERMKKQRNNRGRMEERVRG